MRQPRRNGHRGKHQSGGVAWPCAGCCEHLDLSGNATASRLSGAVHQRLVGCTVACVFAGLVTAALFAMMEELIRVPSESRTARPVPRVALHRFRPSLSSQRVGMQPAVPEARRRWVHPPLPKPRIRIRREIFRPRITGGVGVSPSVRPSASAVAPIRWRSALDERFHGSPNGHLIFSLKPLPSRLPSVLSLPERMHLDAGGEIDRIGDTCYAVPAPLDYNPEATGNPVLQRVNHAMLPLFAHEIPCEATGTRSIAEEFLTRLRKSLHLSSLEHEPVTPPGG